VFESLKRQAFLLKLSDTLRPTGDASDIQARASLLLGERTWAAVEQARAEMAARRGEKKYRSEWVHPVRDVELRQLGEASQDVLWIRDAERLQWQYLTPAFGEVYGLSRDEALSGNNYRSWLDLIVPEDRQHASEGIARMRGGEPCAFEFRIRRPANGEIRWLRDTGFPLRNALGEIDRIGGVSHDITALKQAEEHQKLLLAELQHRVRNTLAVIRAIARRTAESSETVEEMGMHLDGRIAAFARVQAAVTRDPTAGVELQGLIAETLHAARAKEGERVTVQGPTLHLTTKAAETVGLALHELTTNALKYGALSVSTGHITVDWSVSQPSDVEQPAILLAWTERGVTLPGTGPGPDGFGSELLTRTLAYDLNASVERVLAGTGIRYSIRIPATAEILKS
jgi:PAS domain S-box-containing protein